MSIKTCFLLIYSLCFAQINSLEHDEFAFANRPKRISEQECDRFVRLAAKNSNGLCENSGFPHTVSLIDQGGDLVCSGFLVNENHIVTAGHCVSGSIPVKVQFDASTHDVSNFTRHPQYSRSTFQTDLAIVKLKTFVPLSSTMIPVCLASNLTENLYDILVQSGFGAVKDNFKYPRTFIQSDDNQVIATEDCDRIANHNKIHKTSLIRNQLCMIYDNKLGTTDIGASGGPLQSVNSRTCMYTAMGVLSAGISDIKSNPLNITHIDLYSRITYHLDWIEQVVWNV